MTRTELKEYIEQNGNPEIVIAMAKQLQLEGIPLTAENLNTRLHPKPIKKRDDGSLFLTLLASFLMILVLLMLFIVLCLHFAPDSEAAFWIETTIEDLVSRTS